MGLRTSIAVLVAGVALAGTPAVAQDVGTTTAVNPLSESTPPGAQTVALRVGSHVVYKERIHTTPAGSVQLLFLDRSTLSIAPNTNLLIDQYVYDPNSNTGHTTISLTEGALRFVGGKLSHQGAASIVTTAATIGIRGGTVTIVHGQDGTRIINHFGTITIQNDGGTTTINRPGFAVTVHDWNTPPGEPERVTAAEIAHYLNLLTSKPGQDGGVPGFKNAYLDGIGALQGIIDADTPPFPMNNGESNAFQIIIQATQHGTGPIQPPRPRTR
jgi:hypothetical protein